MTEYFKVIQSPVGELTLVADDSHLLAVLWENDKPDRVKAGSNRTCQDNAILLQAEKQLEEYFRGERQEFDLPVQFSGTDFQNKTWKALQSIPYGETRSYGKLAEQIGSPKASRAVGAANGRNPVSIVVPCHRVIGEDGSLTGFAGGIERKSFLLEFERSA